MAKKKATEFKVRCLCGALAPVFDLGEKGYMVQCVGCGATGFIRVPAVLERLRYGDTICPHNPPVLPCKRGYTSFCPRCRIRWFYLEMPTASEAASIRPTHEAPSGS